MRTGLSEFFVQAGSGKCSICKGRDPNLVLVGVNLETETPETEESMCEPCLLDMMEKNPRLRDIMMLQILRYVLNKQGLFG